jgi:hypothetical protein
MDAGLLQGRRIIHSRWRVVRLIVLMAFGLSVLDLPVHLVHHLGEVSPDCQFLALSVSLSSTILDGGWLPTIDRTYDALVVPRLLPYISPSSEPAQARAPPAALQA